MNKITVENYNEIYPYSCARKEILQYWHDQAWLIKSNPQYWYEIKNKVCYVYKRIRFQNPEYIFLAMPPMTLDCDYNKEQELLYDTEYDCVYSYEWVKNLFTPYEKIELQKPERHEFIYYTETYKPENLTGKKNRKWRNAVNKLDKDNYKFEFIEYDNEDVFQSNYILNVLVPEMKTLNKKWIVEKQKKDSTINFWIDLLQNLNNVHILTIRDSNKKLVGYNITQHLGNTVIYSCEKFIGFENFPISKAVHIKLSEFYRKKLGREIFMNKGGSVGDMGMKDNKNLLRPYTKMALYKIRKNG